MYTSPMELPVAGGPTSCQWAAKHAGVRHIDSQAARRALRHLGCAARADPSDEFLGLMRITICSAEYVVNRRAPRDVALAREPRRPANHAKSAPLQRASTHLANAKILFSLYFIPSLR